MHWAQFLHLYQPYYQQPDVLERIVGQSYRPIIEGLFERPAALVTLNVNAVLLELFEKHGYADLTEKLAEMGRRGQIEFLGSAKYHTLLPFLPRAEVERQIELNTEESRKYLGDSFAPKGIFLPEMAYGPNLNEILEAQGFEYVLLDELALNGKTGQVDWQSLYHIEGTKLRAFFRERRLSNAIMHGAVRNTMELKRAAGEAVGAGRYLVTGMDGEVFGWHHPGHERLLFEMLEDPELSMVQIGQLPELIEQTVECAPVACSWADSEYDLEHDQAFYSWRDPQNPIQDLEWQLQALTLEEFAHLDSKDAVYAKLRPKLDPALASDVFFWSSARPWWSIELIEEGAYGLMEVVDRSPSSTAVGKRRARELYRQIMDLAFEWRRSGKIAAIGHERQEILRIPFKDRTDTVTFKGFLKIMHQIEKTAAARQDYEAAAMWRDAQHALEAKKDIYDAYHVIDMLNATLPRSDIEAMLDRYRQDYHVIRGGQPEQRSN